MMSEHKQTATELVDNLLRQARRDFGAISERGSTSVSGDLAVSDRELLHRAAADLKAYGPALVEMMAGGFGVEASDAALRMFAICLDAGALIGRHSFAPLGSEDYFGKRWDQRRSSKNSRTKKAKTASKNEKIQRAVEQIKKNYKGPRKLTQQIIVDKLLQAGLVQAKFEPRTLRKALPKKKRTV